VNGGASGLVWVVSLVCDDNVTMCGVRLEVGPPGSSFRGAAGRALQARGGAVLTVGKDVSQVERRLGAGLLLCPNCRGRLGPWGHARTRRLRGEACSGQRPRRTRCGDCSVTHVLLPLDALVRRADEAEVIGSGLVLAAAGWGHRRVAARLGRPAGTVRGWMRRMRERAEALRAAFTALLVAVDPDPVLPDPAGSVLGEAVAAIVAAAVATVRRWGGVVSGLSAWQLAAAVTSGGLLSPAESTVSINTSCPW
jgi:hypothetical protein